MNIHTKRNLPQPLKLPVHGCPQDPLIYPDAPDPKGKIMEYYSLTSKCSIPGCDHKDCIPPPGCTTSKYPDNHQVGCFKAISTNEKKEVILQKVYRPLVNTWAPFGTAEGLPTNLGIVAMPSNPINGYIYVENGGWVLYATPGRQEEEEAKEVKWKRPSSRATWLPWNRSGPVYTTRSPDLWSSLGHHRQSTSGLRRSCSCCRSWYLRASLEILIHVLGLSLVSRL